MFEGNELAACSPGLDEPKWTFGHNSRVTGGIGISSRPGGAANIRVENETRSVTDVLMTMLSETRIIPPLRV